MLVDAGTVSVSTSGTIVTGVGTDWLTAGIVPGLSVFTAVGVTGHQAVVSRVASDTQLHLVSPWTGAALSAAAYIVTIDFTPIGLPLVDETTADLSVVWNTAMDRIAAELTSRGVPPQITLPKIDETTVNVPNLWNTAMSEITARLADIGIAV